MFLPSSPGDLASYSVRDGYLDAIVRGFQLGLLTKADYDTLVQCDTVDDMKLQLQNTTYGDFLANEQSPIHTTVLAEKSTLKMVQDFDYLRTNATFPLSKFLDYITYGYMIDNIVLLITGTLHKRDVAELKEKCHPLGLFDTMESIIVGQSLTDLYEVVLIDTPLAPYIKDHLSSADLGEMDIELIRNTLYKAYLEDFDSFCVNELGGVTGEVMHGILQFEADRRSINITFNSLGTELSQDDRAKLYPNLGLLYPEGTHKLMLALDQDSVRSAVEHVEIYRKMCADSAFKDGKPLEDAFFEYEVSLNLESFQHQFQYSVFYSYFRLREQEIRNLVWIGECIVQDHRDEITKFIPASAS